MSRIPFFRRLRRAASASVQALGVNRYRTGGHDVRCPVCRGEEFLRSAGPASQRPLLLRLNAPWVELDRVSTVLICAHCTYVLNFGRAPELLDDPPGGGFDGG